MRNLCHWFVCCSLVLVFFFFWKIHPCGGGNKFCFHFSLFIHKPTINNHINLYSCDFITPPESSSLIQLIMCLIIINNIYILYSQSEIKLKWIMRSHVFIRSFKQITYLCLIVVFILPFSIFSFVWIERWMNESWIINQIKW